MIETITLKNLGTVNKNRVDIDYTDAKGNHQFIELYFSYETIVAVKRPGFQLCVAKNEWSNTTGKLLNELEPDKDCRYPHSVIMKNVTEALQEIS